jgi:predicted DNA-binding transcriptional regulator YafY
MRLQQAKRIIDLAIRMRVSHRGLSLDEIADHYEVHRRTAMRMRDVVWDLFPLEERKCDGERFYRWKLDQCNVDLFITPDTKE